MSALNPRECLVEIARTQLSIHETSANHGAGIAKYWEATSYLEGYEDRQPYCAAFLCWVVRQAITTTNTHLGLTMDTRPTSAAVSGWLPWAGRATSGALVFHLGDRNYAPQPGDIVVYVFSHVGLVTSELNQGYMRTIEANTNAAGGREGDGVYEKIRAGTLAKAFIRLAARAEIPA